MGIYKNSWVRNLMTLFTGLIFLNMSFFLAEVSALKLNQDKKLFSNIIKLITSSAAEEEKDTLGGADEDCSVKEIDLIFSYSTHTIYCYIAEVNNKRSVFHQGVPLLGSYEIYSPPPEA
jgi:tryptophanyl-tRNA synthetase